MRATDAQIDLLNKLCTSYNSYNKTDHTGQSFADIYGIYLRACTYSDVKFLVNELRLDTPATQYKQSIIHDMIVADGNSVNISRVPTTR
jgi:hypothetical protein